MRKGKSEIVKEYAKAMGIPVVDLPMCNAEEQLPEWAECRAVKSQLSRYQQLITKYPHQRGNATIIELVYQIRWSILIFIVGTDAGNIMRLTAGELFSMYEPGEFILKELCNSKLYEQLEQE